MSLSDAWRQPGWSKQRIIDELRSWRLQYRAYPPGRQIDWSNPTFKVDWEESAATVLDVYPPGTGGVGFDTVRIEGIEVCIEAADAPSATASPPPPKVPAATIVFELASRCPRGPHEAMYGPDGYAQRMIRSDPRLANAGEDTIANRWYDWNKLPKV